MIVPDIRTLVVNVARAHTWVREEGPNRGEAVEAILSRVGLPAGQPWCAAAVSYIGWSILRKQWPLTLAGGCMTLFDDAVAKGLLRSEPAPGAIFLLWGKAGDGVIRFRHTGFVCELLAGGAWRTAEGNTNRGGGIEGDGFYLRERTFGQADRFIAWWEA